MHTPWHSNHPICEGGAQRTFLNQHHARKAIVQVPEIDAAHTALVVQLPVNVKGLIGLDLHLAHPLVGDRALAGALAAAGPDAAHAALVQRRVELVAPWRAVAVAVAVVVAEEVVAARLLAALDGEGLVDGRQEVLGQVRGQGDDCVEVLARVLGVEAAEEVALTKGYQWMEFFIRDFWRLRVGIVERAEMVVRRHQGGRRELVGRCLAWRGQREDRERIGLGEEGGKLTAPSQRDPQPLQLPVCRGGRSLKSQFRKAP